MRAFGQGGRAFCFFLGEDLHCLVLSVRYVREEEKEKEDRVEAVDFCDDGDTELNLTELNLTGLIWTGLDWTGLSWPRCPQQLYK